MRTITKAIRVCRLANSEFFLRHHLRHQIESQLAEGFDVHLAYPKESEHGLLDVFPAAKHHFLPFARKPNPLIDIAACVGLLKILFREKIQIIHTVTPKAGLVGAVIGAFARVPVRVHTFTGQVWATKSGLFRLVLKKIDRLIIKLNTLCYADSWSQVTYLVNEGVCAVDDVKVIGAGSLSGFDADHFCTAKFETQRQANRSKLGFTDADFVVNFTGRLNPDKGVLDLCQAVLMNTLPERVKLLLVGPLDGSESFKIDLTSLISQSSGRIVIVGYQSDPAAFLGASDLFAMPSYREGFGGVLVEAAMMGLPVVSTLIPGPMDAVEHGITGLLVPAGDIKQISESIKYYAENLSAWKLASENGLARARKLFDFRVINAQIISEYYCLLEARGV